MTIEIIRPGMLTTVQDRGRTGWQQYGVAVGGAMDSLALRTANLLVGNEQSAAGLEITLLGPELRFEQDCLIAIIGAELSPRVRAPQHDWIPVPRARPVLLRRGSVLAFGAVQRGCRAYLAVAGGLNVPLVLDGRGTYLQANIGGLEGRALQAGDVLPLGTPTSFAKRIAASLAHQQTGNLLTVPWGARILAENAAEPRIRVLRGSEAARLTLDSELRLYDSDFTVSPESDRMGYRLLGPSLTLFDTGELISTAVCPGTIQVPPDGQPIVLMADGATTGGYAKVAHVVSVDLSRLAQLEPGDRFRMRAISLEEAHNLYLQREGAIRCLSTAMKLKFAD